MDKNEPASHWALGVLSGQTDCPFNWLEYASQDAGLGIQENKKTFCFSILVFALLMEIETCTISSGPH